MHLNAGSLSARTIGMISQRREFYMKTGGKKLKALYLMKILLDETDENNALTMEQIISKLDAYGIEAERKSLYDDINALRDY